MRKNQQYKNRTNKPIQISKSLRNLNRNFFYKFGKLDYIIHSKWLQIVGVFFMDHSEPQKIVSVPLSKDESGNLIYAKYLHVNVSPSAAIEFQHFQNKIIEKINSYFGYKAISGIKIRQKFMQNNLMKEKNSANDIHKNVKKLNHNLENINDKELKQSIVNLGLSITNKNF